MSSLIRNVPDSPCSLDQGAAWLGVLLLVAGQALGQVSVLDSSFSVGSGTDGPVDGLVVQQDQRILVGGEFATIGGVPNAYLARLNADGSVDASFNTSGPTDGQVLCMSQQPDRKVLIGGSFNQLLGVERHGLARLLEDGSVDPSLNPNTAFGTSTTVTAIGLQSDGRILIAYYTNGGDRTSFVARLNTSGTPDPAWVNTNVLTTFVTTFLIMPDASILAGGEPFGSQWLSLFRLQSNGQLDEGFNSGLVHSQSSVGQLARRPDGHVLVGGVLTRTGETNSVPLLQLTSDLQWDTAFIPDAFGASAVISPPAVTGLLLQPDGKIVVGGSFFQVGGYTRAQIARLTPEGHVDKCFDPGLGLGYDSSPNTVRAMDRQADGRIVIGGSFDGTDGAYYRRNIARLLPQSYCDMIRVYLAPGWVAAATLPPGGTNVLETSEDLENWHELQRSTNTYLFSFLGDVSSATAPAFFRARQER